MGSEDDCTDVGDTSTPERDWTLSSEQPGTGSTSLMMVLIVSLCNKAALPSAILGALGPTLVLVAR